MSIIDPADMTNVHCEKCGQPMVVRRRRSDDAEFLGCSQWPDRCKHTMPLPESVRMRRAGAPTFPGME